MNTTGEHDFGGAEMFVRMCPPNRNSTNALMANSAIRTIRLSQTLSAEQDVFFKVLLRVNNAGAKQAAHGEEHKNRRKNANNNAAADADNSFVELYACFMFTPPI
jgi:hypothetical protein